MRTAPAVFELCLIAVILLLGAANGVIYGMVRSEAAVSNPALVARGIPAGGSPPAADATPSPSQLAEIDDSEDIPGRFVPTQGRRHTSTYPLDQRVEFCPESQAEETCYASNPPTSGLHIPVQRDVRLADGNRITLPPDPDIYKFEIPRESIPHIQEHAGLFAGYNCASENCIAAVTRMEEIVAREISLGGRVIMAPDSDLAEDTIALASWTRVDVFPVAEYDDTRVRRFIKVNSCRFDPEGFCHGQPVN